MNILGLPLILCVLKLSARIFCYTTRPHIWRAVSLLTDQGFNEPQILRSIIGIDVSHSVRGFETKHVTIVSILQGATGPQGNPGTPVSPAICFLLCIQKGAGTMCSSSYDSLHEKLSGVTSF